MYKLISNVGNNVQEESCGPVLKGGANSSFGYGRDNCKLGGYTGGYKGEYNQNQRGGYTGGYSGPYRANEQRDGYTGYTGPSRKIVPNSIGVFSACDELPSTNNGKLFSVAENYQLMDQRAKSDKTIQFLSTMGLQEMQDYNIVDNPIGGKGVYYPYDGRVVDVARNIKMVLDKPAIVGAVDQNLVSTIDNSNYMANYRTYEDIKNGQISYYVNKDVSQPFDGDVYTIPSYVSKTLRVDPMGSVKPEYIKTPITSTLHHLSRDQATRDELSFREDIMSRQQNLYNRTSWTNRWINAGSY